jgi:hypothetical protein
VDRAALFVGLRPIDPQNVLVTTGSQQGSICSARR